MTRWFAPIALTCALWLGTAPVAVFAQQPETPPAEGASEGRPLDGYLATLCLVGGVLFVVGKSARR